VEQALVAPFIFSVIATAQAITFVAHPDGRAEWGVI
jgi:hypothetical protein